ncbi:MAG: FAD-binding oxidoreductase [Planctomycetota bacterium]
MRAKTVVVGGGVMGTSIALRLAERCDPLQEPVVLLERSDLGAGSSGRSGAILRQLYADPGVAMMARDSLRSYARFEGRTARSIGFRRTGVLWVAGPSKPEWIERFDAHLELLTPLGIDLRRVGRAEMEDLIPGLHVDDGAVGLWEPDAGYVDPRQTVEAFAALARTYGAVTRLGTAVTDIVTEAGRVVGVETTGESFEAECVIVCAGPWSRELLSRAGYELPLKIVRPENHFLGLPHSYREVEGDAEELAAGRGVNLEDPLEAISEELAGAVDTGASRAHPVLLDFERGFYARCEPDQGRTRIGHVDYGEDSVIDDADALSEEVSAETQAWAREVLSERMPVYGREPDVGSLAAWYTLTPDAQPIIGPLQDTEGLFVVTGFSGHGFKLAPSISEGVAQMVAGETISAFKPKLFSPERFGDPETVDWSGAFGL